MPSPLLVFYRFRDQNTTPAIPGYFAVSTAPDNVEDPEYNNPLVHAGILDGVELVNDSRQAIIQIAADLEAANQGGEPAELVIAIHGYNTDLSSVKDRHLDTWRYANRHIATKNTVFLGYRWPSEQVRLNGKTLKNVVTSLPVLLSTFLGAGILGVFLLFTVHSLLVALISSIAVFLAIITIALMLLRVSGYFRDSYRATNFGVPDLVELVRQLDQAVEKLHMQQAKQAGQPYDPNNFRRIKLSFIAHSMGGFVTTNVLRILSDVFDGKSIGTIDGFEKAPDSDLGTAFRLGRLVLVAPDIPFTAITLGRANFLKSSLRRCEEAYLFSNEGDLILRIASTAANYFIYPTNSREWGHRLGNVTVRPINKPKDPVYGIVNRAELADDPLQVKLLRYLEINTLIKPVSLEELEKEDNPDEESIANLFTYFDCTDYVDVKDGTQGRPTNILSYRLDRDLVSNTIAYIRLLIASISGKIDTHGGYFNGKLTKDMIYKLAFLGFQDYLKTIADPTLFAESKPPEKPDQSHQFARLLQQFSELCASKRIQIAFSPERYLVDLMGEERTAVRTTILCQPKVDQSELKE
ncbi:MAG: hypothetical protein LH647_14215 [Leptolyngbyaceae cyanobacterium CAN_BIN12]|nr:hypothetical protein [Leptolyngbyaceae cyanobacterium CAN_BIN12]